MANPEIHVSDRTLQSKKLQKKPVFIVDNSLMPGEILVTGITERDYLLRWIGGDWTVIKCDPKEKEPELILTEDGIWTRPHNKG